MIKVQFSVIFLIGKSLRFKIQSIIRFFCMKRECEHKEIKIQCYEILFEKEFFLFSYTYLQV